MRKPPLSDFNGLFCPIHKTVTSAFYFIIRYFQNEDHLGLSLLESLSALTLSVALPVLVVVLLKVVAFANMQKILGQMEQLPVRVSRHCPILERADLDPRLWIHRKVSRPNI